ncbi:uncharacterized protein LOC115831894 [Nomascus leucogenys]|uniref:uncharacterized protein LOC115831894 n=1 Tax=Nomascus leucogenys TaxID=61853 RepID=UPI00122D6E4C|nr:uncharacterized protein LOC115831894 [Nomascus leucogenys]
MPPACPLAGVGFPWGCCDEAALSGNSGAVQLPEPLCAQRFLQPRSIFCRIAHSTQAGVGSEGSGHRVSGRGDTLPAAQGTEGLGQAGGFLTPEGSWVSCRADTEGLGSRQAPLARPLTSAPCPSSQLPSGQEAHEDSEGSAGRSSHSEATRRRRLRGRDGRSPGRTGLWRLMQGVGVSKALGWGFSPGIWTGQDAVVHPQRQPAQLSHTVSSPVGPWQRHRHAMAWLSAFPRGRGFMWPKQALVWMDLAPQALRERGVCLLPPPTSPMASQRRWPHSRSCSHLQAPRAPTPSAIQTQRQPSLPRW